MIAQEVDKHPGSIIRINLDGSVPKDNPHFNSLKCTLSSPTKKPKLAISELFIRYFYRQKK